MEFWKNISSNPFAWLFTVIIGVLSVVLAYRSMPRKKIKCFLNNRELITNKHSKYSKLSILYDGCQVERLTVTKVIFFNSGYPTIKGEDLIEKAPFSITINNGKILDLCVLMGKDTSNQVDVEYIDESNAKIIFDYLDTKEGGIIQIIHTGEEESVIVSKKIKGGRIVTNKDYKNILIVSLLLNLLILICIVIDKSFDGIFPKSWYVMKEVNTLKDFYLILISMPLMLLCFCSLIVSSFRGERNYTPKNCKSPKKQKKDDVI